MVIRMIPGSLKTAADQLLEDVDQASVKNLLNEKPDGIHCNLQVNVKSVLVLYSFFVLRFFLTRISIHRFGIHGSFENTSFCIDITVTKRPSSHGHTLPF
jgi:hypothetical protein